MSHNPFNQLYVGEKISPAEFVEIFSTELIKPAMPLFEPGNVVLSGVQGTGKSMLFKLLLPEQRLAYANAGLPFPVPEQAPRFIGAGINVNHARCNEFGHRRPSPGDHQQELMFADFLNYYICLDLIGAVQRLSLHESTAKELGIRFDERASRALGTSLARNPGWFGYFDSVGNIDAFQARIEQRLLAYRRYLGGNDLQLDAAVAQTKTQPGDPMKVVVETMRELAVIPPDLEVFVLIDQYEELSTIKDPDGNKADYRAVVNNIINRRDSALSYRIGTRGYAWRDHVNIFGTDANIEQDRDFKLVDLDAKLKRYEDSSTDIFPAFARNVFERRMRRYEAEGSGTSVAQQLRDVLGKSDTPAAKARTLAGRDPVAALRLDSTWPADLRAGLKELAFKEEPLEAKLAEAWVRQKGWSGGDHVGHRPWQSKPYWRKERIQVALLKVAGAKRQRLIYAGEDDIVSLSGGNILTFLSICQHIWDNAIQAGAEAGGQVPLPIKSNVQTIGVFQAGRWWLDRIPLEYGRGDERFRFVQRLGEMFNNLLNDDQKMSYPGHTGFSMTIEDFKDNPDVENFLSEAVDYGNLVRREHTTRYTDKKRRIKFYLNPIYCPIYRIPVGQTKEPKYVSAAEVRLWMYHAGVSGLDLSDVADALRQSGNGSPRTGATDNDDADLPLLRQMRDRPST